MFKQFLTWRNFGRDVFVTFHQYDKFPKKNSLFWLVSFKTKTFCVIVPSCKNLDRKEQPLNGLNAHNSALIYILIVRVEVSQSMVKRHVKCRSILIFVSILSPLMEEILNFEALADIPEGLVAQQS